MAWRDSQPEDFERSEKKGKEGFERGKKQENEPSFPRRKQTLIPGFAFYIAAAIGLGIGLGIGEFRLQKYHDEVVKFGQDQGQTQATLQKTIADLQAQVSALSNTNLKLGADNASLTKQLSESSGLRTQVRDLNQKLSTAEKKSRGLESDLGDEQSKSRDLQGQVDDLKNQIRLLKKGSPKQEQQQ